MLLIFTSSFDATTDLIISRLDAPVFRWNRDLMKDYSVSFEPGGFVVSVGDHRVRSDDVKKCYWRKPHHGEFEGLSAYAREEVSYVFREAFNWLRLDGKAVFVEPDAERRLGKIIQMRLAADLFSVPDWRWTSGLRPSLQASDIVTKSLTTSLFEDHKVLYTTRIQTVEQLDPGEPWLLQEAVVATHDVTAVFAHGRCFAFSLERSAHLDWREGIGQDNQQWAPFALSGDQLDCISEFMRRCGLEYGRLDFLLSSQGTLHFLEVNPNGQWAWLDLDGRHGLFEYMLSCLRSW